MITVSEFDFLNLIFLTIYLMGIIGISFYFWRLCKIESKQTASVFFSGKYFIVKTLGYFLISGCLYWAARSINDEGGPFFLLVGSGLILFSVIWKAAFERVRGAKSKLREQAAHRESTYLTNAVGGEFRTQLNGIMGAANLLQVTNLSFEQKQYVSMVKTCSESLQQLISELIANSREGEQPESKQIGQAKNLLWGIDISGKIDGSKSETNKSTKSEERQIGYMKVFSKGALYSLTDKTSRTEGLVSPGGNDQSISILVADDVEVNLVVLRKYLEKLGCYCDTAVNGSEVIEMVRNKNYDLVLMDCQMPEVDGYQATKEILKFYSQAESRPYIVAVTAHGNQEELDKSRAAGMDGFITKPFSIKHLQETLEKVKQARNEKSSQESTRKGAA